MITDQELTILLVDDLDANLVALEELLTTDNRKFLRASNGNDALKLALKNEQIGLIMLDVQMPGMDGFEVARLLKSNTKTRDISIIFVTAINKEEQYILKGFEYGAVDYLQKPLDLNITQAKVRVFEQLYFYQLELKRTLAEKEKINKQLEQFMYVVAHDLKSPLHGVISLLSFLQEDERVNHEPDLQETTGMIMKASQHLSYMISSILDYSRQADWTQTTEEVNVYQLVKEIARLLFPPAHILITPAPDLPVLRTRKLKLQQVLQNLISNAIKYNDKPEGRITISAVAEGGFYRFSVTDNGPGIAEEDQERVFRLFETTENSSSGESATGIGLNITKMFVEEQGGRLWVESTPGTGSSFYFLWR
jgi:two-component system, sensor histidine kinase and response regulator